MAKNDSKTKAFSTNTKKSKKSVKNKKRVRRKVVVSIFAIIALILVVFAALIIAKIIEKANDSSITPNTPTNENITYIPRDAGNVKMGNLLLINDAYTYSLPSDLSDMINISYDYRKNEVNKDIIKIGNTHTYALTYDSICLTQETLDAFSKMIFDYCNSIETSETNKNSVSNLEIAWGGYSESTREEYEHDITSYGKDYYDHALGTTVTLKVNSPSTVITESILKTQFTWIYENAHKYGFILRSPEACKNHLSYESTKRVHLRYIGVEHATYIFNNNICFEEYLELIKTNHTINNPLVIIANGKTYNVYYVAYSGNPTSVPVPKDSNYVISGDNMNGFIVSVEK